MTMNNRLYGNDGIHLRPAGTASLVSDYKKTLNPLLGLPEYNPSPRYNDNFSSRPPVPRSHNTHNNSHNMRGRQHHEMLDEDMRFLTALADILRLRN
jgi:hypothetical protein